MLKKSLLIVVMMLVALGCANQQKEDTEQKEDADVVVEEISLAVTGMM